MAMLNIPSTNDDPSYRYKMPRLASKKEGRGNGSKTCVVNMGDVAQALKRPPQYTTKWFGFELGAQSTYTNKEGEGERCVINGHHDTPVFQTMLDKFIDKYVLCQNCHLPEIDMLVKKGNIMAKCKACGWGGDLDNGHKIATFILKNPPDAGGFGVCNLAGGAAEGGKEKTKDERRKEREEKRKARAEQGDGEGEDDGEDGEDAAKEKKEKKERKEKKEKKDKTEKKVEEKPAESDDSDGKDEGQNEEEDVGYDSEIVQAVIEVMRQFLKTKTGPVKPDEFFEELRMQQLAKLFDHKVRLYVTLESLMPSGSMDGKAVGLHKALIDKVLAATKISANDILWCFDTYLAVNEKAVKGFPMVLKVIYDEEWANEAELTKYYGEDEGEGQPGFDAAKKAGAPFLTWLETADASDDDDDDDEEDSD